MTTRKAPPQIQPPVWEPKHAASIRALAAGTASEHQQKLALDWIINRAAATYDQSFSPDNHSLTDFAEGRRFVGNQIVKLINLDPALINKKKESDDNGRP